MPCSETSRPAASTSGSARIPTVSFITSSTRNDAVNVNNVRMEQFPDMLLVGLAGLARRPLFAAAEKERADVHVGALLAR